jgi:predicted transcriptional regulator
MKTPCELVVKAVLPTVRASIARELIREHGKTQKEAAKILGVTTAAVSQYLSEKRATKRYLDAFQSEEFDHIVRQAAHTIASSPGELETMKAFCRCCMNVRAKKLLCSMHQEIAPDLHDCEWCQALECEVRESLLPEAEEATS